MDEFSIEDLPTPSEGDSTWLAYGFPLAKQDGMFVDGAIVSGRAPLGGYEAIQLTCNQGGFEPIKGFNPESQTEAEVLTLAGLSGAAVTHGAAVVGLISWGPAMLGARVIYAIPVKLIASACREFDKAQAIQRDNYFQHIQHRRAQDAREGKAVIFNLAQVGGASRFSGKLEEFFEEYLVTETGLRTVPFGGRDEDVALLDAWLDDEDAPPRYLLTAPAGRGKGALLVYWLQHLQAQGRVGRDAPASWQLIFVPISIRFETHRPDIFYEAIAAGLAAILSEELPPPQTDKGVYYAEHCRRLASAAVAQGRRILIVLDGIDEALGERFDARWFPRNPGTRLRLVCSARWQADDLDSSGWKTRLDWHRDVRAQSRELPILTRDGVRDLLLKMGAPTDVLASRPDIVDRLYALAEGEPLVLRYYAEDIWGKGEAASRLTIDDLARMRPGFGAYFKRWLDDQERLWQETGNLVDRRRVEVILEILACAHGRLTGADLRALLAEGGETVVGARFLEQLKPIQRFVIGRDHPETGTAGYILT